MTASLAPILYLPHGGGPLPLLGDSRHRDLTDFLKAFAPALGRPDAILVISAHWETEPATITAAAEPRLIYDYFGFPPAAYEISYPAPGAPDVARRIVGLLGDAGMEVAADAERGFDHGLFVPLKLLFPSADVPCVQLSLLAGLDPTAHIRMGRALAPLRRENVLILGSGFSFHNLRLLMRGGGGEDAGNERFQDWLVETCAGAHLNAEERERRLVHWTAAPAARYCHPREEHLLPLHVCYGVAGAPGRLVFDGPVMGKRACAFLWDRQETRSHSRAALER